MYAGTTGVTTTGTAVSQASGTASEQNSSTYNFWCSKSKKKRKTLSSYKANIALYLYDILVLCNKTIKNT